MKYEEFVAGKLLRVPPSGFEPPKEFGAHLFPFQRDLVRWALRRGRCAIFASTGLGKTAMSLEWGHQVLEHLGRGRVLILAPLAVAQQTAKEGERIGIPVTVCRETADVRDGINVTNYDRIDKFDATAFDAVILDESSSIKHFDSKTFVQLTSAFRHTPYRLCCTATPAPNDYTEFGTHAEFLGICSRPEMLSEYFCHDGGETSVWRLKGHAKTHFWQWVASWGVVIQLPSDIGHDDADYILPPLEHHEHTIPAQHVDALAIGKLFLDEARTLGEQRDARRASITDRVQRIADMVNASDESWIVWCDLNAESTALAKAIPDAIEVTGSDSIDEKESRIAQFSQGRARVLVSKSSICGWGMNWQHCRNIAFCGVTHSWEAYYQAVRRCWRFGQKRPVNVHVVCSELEGRVIANLQRKEQDAVAMHTSMREYIGAYIRQEVGGSHRQSNEYTPRKAMRLPRWEEMGQCA